MHQLISVAVLLAVAVLLNGPLAMRMAADGNWGEAIGRLFFGPVVFFYLVHSVIFYAMRLFRRAEGGAGYATSRLNYISMVISLLGVLGAVAQRLAPPA